MASSLSIDRHDLCQHDEYRIGCLSCCAHGTRADLEEAIEEKEKREEGVKSYQALLEQGDVSGVEQKRFEERIERLEAQREALGQRSKALEKMLVSVEAKVRDVCTQADPKALREAFESNAAEREDELRQIWRNAATTESGKELLVFKKEDPNRQLSFKGLDRSNIPATPDVLVSDGVGLEMFLKAGRISQRLPSQAVGENTGPAIMSYGRALEMFGVPDGLGKDPWQKSELSVEPSIEDMTPLCSIAGAPTAATLLEPRTERECRQLRDPPIDPLLSEEQQWALFGKKKHMGDAAILARQYAKLVAEKENPVVPDSATNAATDSGGWPPVDQLTWAGFTNWVYRCKQVDKTFGRATLPKWNAERLQRMNTLVAKLKEWKAPEGFDDGTSKYPDPRQYYTGDSIDFDDMKKLGMKTTGKTKR